MRYLIKKLLKKFKIKDYAATNWKQIISEHKKVPMTKFARFVPV